MRLELKEFSAPTDLKDEIESRIMDLLCDTSTIEFNSLPLARPQAVLAERQLKLIASRTNCTIETKMQHAFTDHMSPKIFFSNPSVFQPPKNESKEILAWYAFFYRTPIAKGNLEIHIGDIGSKQVRVTFYLGIYMVLALYFYRRILLSFRLCLMDSQKA